MSFVHASVIVFSLHHSPTESDRLSIESKLVQFSVAVKIVGVVPTIVISKLPPSWTIFHLEMFSVIV